MHAGTSVGRLPHPQRGWLTLTGEHSGEVCKDALKQLLTAGLCARCLTSAKMSDPGLLQTRLPLCHLFLFLYVGKPAQMPFLEKLLSVLFL